MLYQRIQRWLRPPESTEEPPVAREPDGVGQRVLGLVGAAVHRFLDVSADERKAASSDVDRVRGLLRDAVGTLQSSFTMLDRTSRAQNGHLSALVAKLGSSEAGENDISIRDFVKRTETTLQYFTDLLAQISKQSIEASYKMDDMVGALDEMFALVGRVDEVTDRTNLLALNASITAAQSGEAGKAFGVVANEVKQLSRSSKELNGSLNDQVAVTRAAIEETRHIIREMASKDLIVALQAKDHVDTMLKKLVALDQHLNSTLVSVGGAAQDIAGGVEAATRALQFEDIVSQVLAHVQSRLERIDPLASVLTEALDPRADEPAEATTTRLVEARMAIDEVAENNEQNNRRHVEQQSMSAGDVELF